MRMRCRRSGTWSLPMLTRPWYLTHLQWVRGTQGGKSTPWIRPVKTWLMLRHLRKNWRPCTTILLQMEVIQRSRRMEEDHRSAQRRESLKSTWSLRFFRCSENNRVMMKDLTVRLTRRKIATRSREPPHFQLARASQEVLKTMSRSRSIWKRNWPISIASKFLTAALRRYTTKPVTIWRVW